MGNTGCLMGSYILAGELARHGNDVDGALKSYNEKMRPIVKDCQQQAFGSVKWLLPSSQIGMWMTRNLLILVAKVSRMMANGGSDGKKDEMKIPEYPELKLDS